MQIKPNNNLNESNDDFDQAGFGRLEFAGSSHPSLPKEKVGILLESCDFARKVSILLESGEHGIKKVL